ncbi:MAG: gluconate 2-dehydrogenase subunit 3 family protein [Pseudomonadota bacterium]
MTTKDSVRGLTRRELLARGVAAGAALSVGAGFVMHPGEAWAVEVKALTPRTMASLVQLARDIYPHDQVADRYYAAAVKAHDEQAAGDDAHRALIEDGIATLDTMAQGAGAPSYIETGWEADRVALLRQIETSPFFQAVRGGLVVGLYNQKELWPLFGYEGSSYEHGGYLDRGFDDIAWL